MCLIQRQLSMTGTPRTGMASGQLLENIGNDHWPPDSPELWSVIISGLNVGDLSQAPSKTQINHPTERNIAGDLGQPATGTDQHSPTSPFCRLSHAGRTKVVPSTRRTMSAIVPFQWLLPRAWNSLPSSVRNASSSMSYHHYHHDLKTTFSVVVRSSLGDSNCTTLQLLSACGHRLSALLPVLFC